MNFRLAITMPVFNEEQGIVDFLLEISESLADYELSLFVVDDYSTDQTVNRLVEFQTQFPEINLVVIENEKNIGHGPSTIKGMSLALTINPDAVLTVDGDGQFIGKDIAKIVKTFIEGQVDVLEGVRIKRTDPFFRKISTEAVRLLVWSRCHEFPADGNTPLRIYRSANLLEILSTLPSNLFIPNVYVSAYLRVQKWNVLEVEVTSIPPRGKDPLGSTWKQKFKKLPSKRFLKFCLRALLQWQKTKIPKYKVE